MPHQCTKCGKVYPDASEELLKGCNCGSKFFYYIKQEKFDSLQSEVQKVMEELEKTDIDQIEKDIRELTGLDKKPDEPVILDLESIKVIKPGKFEIDIVSLFSKNRPLIYKLGEGKYIIDIASSLDTKNIKNKIKSTSFLEFGEEKETEDESEEESENEEDDEPGNEESEANSMEDISKESLGVLDKEIENKKEEVQENKEIELE